MSGNASIYISGSPEAIEKIKAERKSTIVNISASALVVAIEHALEAKDVSLEAQQFSEAAEWNHEAKELIMALGGFGLTKTQDRI